MSRLLLAALLILPCAARAEDEPSGASKMFGSFLKKGVNAAAGRELVTDRQVEGAIKTTKAFRKSAEEITDREEYFIGRSVSANVLSRFKRLDDAALNNYVQAVLQSVAAASDRPEIAKGYHAQVLESEDVNALSAPGGFVFVTTGLLKSLESEDQLAAVLAHEVAHISLKHGLKTIKASRLTAAFQILGSEVAKDRAPENLAKLTEAFGGSIDDIVKNLVVNGYSRDKEYEADKHGAAFAKRANYDPKALTQFIDKLKSAKGGGLLKTHPSAGARLKELADADLAPSSDYRDAPARRKRFEAAAKRL
jgi:beta-barrel assembly-enhancing protease